MDTDFPWITDEVQDVEVGNITNPNTSISKAYFALVLKADIKIIFKGIPAIAAYHAHISGELVKGTILGIVVGGWINRHRKKKEERDKDQWTRLQGYRYEIMGEADGEEDQDTQESTPEPA